MEIQLRRTAVPEEMGPGKCAICGDDFEIGTVRAWVYGGGGPVGGTRDSVACPACVEVLGSYRPDRFPTIEEYRRLEAEWPTPMFASVEELERVDPLYA